MDEQVRGYAICCTQRVGSNYLGALLSDTGRLGRPAEYFNKRSSPVKGMTDYPDDPALQVQQVLISGTTPNGVYGLKVFPDQFDRVIKTRWPEVLPNLSFILLERDDLLGQAISLVKARQTGRWESDKAAKNVARYDDERIKRVLMGVVEGQARWRFWFARTGVTPLRLRYEQVVADPQGAVDAVSDLVGLEDRPLVDPARAPFAIQRDAESESWRARFIHHHGEMSVFD